MNPARLLSNFPIGRKFTVILILQTLSLALVGFLGWRGIQGSQEGTKRVGGDLLKTQIIST